MLKESITKEESVTGIHFLRRFESGGCATADCINSTINRKFRYIFPGRTRASKLQKIYGIGLLVVSFELWVIRCKVQGVCKLENANCELIIGYETYNVINGFTQ